MLYDNAQLARTYVRAWATLAGGDRPAIDAYRLVAIQILEYALRELRRDDGTFAASQDADTDRVEGATFTWAADEIDELLDEEAAAEFRAVYGVRNEGNWEGRTILSRLQPAVAEDGTIDAAREARLAGSRARLLTGRATRPQPKRDDKAIA